MFVDFLSLKDLLQIEKKTNMFDICIPNTDVLQECYNKKIVEIILGPNNILESQFNEQLCFIPDSVPGTLFS